MIIFKYFFLTMDMRGIDFKFWSCNLDI